MPNKKQHVDIKQMIDACRDSEEERDKEVHVAIYVDVTAPDRLVQTVRQAFTPAAPNAFLHVEPYDDQVPDVTEDTDLCLALAGKSDVTGELYAQCARKGIPCVVACMSMTRTLERAEQAGGSISPLDVVTYPVDVEDPGEADDRFLFSLGSWIVDACRDLRVALAAAFPFLRKAFAFEIVKATSFQNGVFGAITIIPGADMPILTLNQVKMVLQIAAAYDVDMGLSRIKELAAVVGGGFGFRALARQLVSLAPALGWAIKGAIGYSGTLAMGYAALEYFDSGCTLAGLPDRISDIRDKADRQSTELAGKRQTLRDISRRMRERIDVELVEVSDAFSQTIKGKKSAS
jgi:uncharacterized protein (DUF697 family)